MVDYNKYPHSVDLPLPNVDNRRTSTEGDEEPKGETLELPFKGRTYRFTPEGFCDGLRRTGVCETK